MIDEKEFEINSHLTLRLENGKTKIYIGGEEFLICKTAILNFPKNKVNEVETMDEIIESSEIIEGEDLEKYGITPLTEFWVHCSNLQVWAENDYNANFLETNLAFPLLKRLSEVGDIKAKRKLIDEIAHRYVYGSYNTKHYLEYEGFLNYLTMEELIVGGLNFEESSLLLDIIEYMKRLGITYDIVLSFDEDKVRHRLSPSERYLTIENGHVYVFEFDMSAESYHFFMKFSAFKGLRNLIIYLGDLEELTIDFSKVKLESIVGLEIYHQSLLEIPSKIFNIFPNLQYLKIYS